MAAVAGRFRILFRWSVLGRLAVPAVDHVAAAIGQYGWLVDAGSAPVDGGGSQAEAVFHRERDAGGVGLPHLRGADEDVAKRIGAAEVDGRVEQSARGDPSARILFD